MTKIEEMIRYCEQENIYYFCDLVKYAIENRKDWFRTVVTENGSRIKHIALVKLQKRNTKTQWIIKI